MGRIRQFLKAEHGATAIEYGLLISLMTVAMMGTYFSNRESMMELYEYIGDEVIAAMGGG